MTKIKDITNLLQQLAPLTYQESYDNSGLQTGDPNIEVTGVLVTLDCTLAVLDEALAAGCNLIVAHHPVIFRPLKQLTGRDEVEKIIIQAIKRDIAIYACHTNLDNVLSGVNAKICEKLGLQYIRILSPKTGNLLKLITFAPLTDTPKVLAALYAAGAGQIGEYQNCSFRVSGTGTFKPSVNANPHIGEAGQQEEVAENRLEVILPDHLKDKILTALFAAHPYEEVAYDIYRLENANQETGAGMIGNLPEALTPPEFLDYLKAYLQLNALRHTEFTGDKIKKVALCGGAGSFLIKDALRQGADAFVTADLKYHEFFIPEKKMLLADIGHYESEVFTKEIFYDIIRKKFSNFAVLKSKVNTNPVRYT
ncbi:GTP cyclohydrolase 1 type 2 [Adhaeribacter aerolatus]|uniref:GTP cyclohydrolase 1 type 2 homolog n=1 Tax=Adhaeribacter aerolatus TaxID=670289 RepID=A0A512AZ20_9BACT|nr:Nif3-like dinuclear metal center hexameric protein [Adhaeribacter aerolatus]GEO04968.1 GTP cyclohydrolase 1 type 2 [Adhaeribacter aerolatus]